MAGSFGSSDGVGAVARFQSPEGIAVDKSGVVYVADTSNHIIRRISPTGVVVTLAGSAGTSGNADGTGASAKFSRPTGVAVDGHGNVYVADSGNGTIRKITQTGIVTTLRRGAGSLAPAVTLTYPTRLAVDEKGYVYVVATTGHTVYKVDGNGTVDQVAGVPGVAGFLPGPAPGLLAFPRGIAYGRNRLVVTTSDGVASIRLR
jgi:sugar lactone lactonase YvrE